MLFKTLATEGRYSTARPEHLVELRAGHSPVALLHSHRLDLQLGLTTNRGMWKDFNQSKKLDANMQHPLLLVNLLLCGTSHGQRPFINIFDEFIHQLDVFNLLDSPRPPPTLRPLRPVPRPPARPRQPSAPRKPKKVQESLKLPPILNHGDGAASDAWVKFDKKSSDENYSFAGAHIGGRLPALPCC